MTGTSFHLHTASEMHRRVRLRLINQRMELADRADEHARRQRDGKELAARYEALGLGRALALLDEVYLAIEGEATP